MNELNSKHLSNFVTKTLSRNSSFPIWASTGYSPKTGISFWLTIHQFFCWRCQLVTSKFYSVKNFNSYDHRVAAAVHEHFNGHTVKSHFNIFVLGTNFINSGYRVNLWIWVFLIAIIRLNIIALSRIFACSCCWLCEFKDEQSAQLTCICCTSFPTRDKLYHDLHVYSNRNDCMSNVYGC